MTATASHPHSQAAYQVRFDWGAAGLAQIAPEAEAVIWVDELGAEPVPAWPDGVAVARAGLASAAHAASWALARQEARGGRFRVAVVAAGATRPDGSLRFAVEDLFAAGAIIDALAELGIDHNSPEAAAAAAAYTGLSRAMRHLLSASASSREGHTAAAEGSELRVIRE